MILILIASMSENVILTLSRNDLRPTCDDWHSSTPGKRQHSNVKGENDAHKTLLTEEAKDYLRTTPTYIAIWILTF